MSRATSWRRRHELGTGAGLARHLEGHRSPGLGTGLRKGFAIDTHTPSLHPVAAPTPTARAALRPLGPGGSRIRAGFWHARQQTNRDVTIPSAASRLEESGTLQNLRSAAAGAGGPYEGRPFADSDVYKWLEALAWEQAREPAPELARWQEATTALVARAQADDGYLNSHVQVTRGGADRYADLESGHELYCAGHLMQAAVAQHRATGDRALLEVAVRLADHLVATFGPGGRDGVDGHPEVETALVELFRETGRREYLELGRSFVERRGHGTLGLRGHHGPAYLQDRVPVREADTVEGHAVRAMYLAAGATDVAVETGDEQLLSALQAAWDSMVTSKMYLTGGIGSRWYGEAFGDPYELPPDAAYCETCAAIGSVQWSWRLLLATGRARYADLIERTLYNAVLPGVSLDGRDFFYVNTLRVRDGAFPDDQRSALAGRQPWYGTACCPPNVMRTFASLDHYLATTDDHGVQVHQYAPGDVRATVAGAAALRVTTEYPRDGRVELEVVDTPAAPWTLSLRIPSWAVGATVTVDGEAVPGVGTGGYLPVRRTWRRGDRVTLDLPVRPRLTVPDPRVESVRGCVAIERGPLVYCFEQTDQPDVVLDHAVLEDDPPREVPLEAPLDGPGGALGGLPAVQVRARVASGPAPEGLPYHDSRDAPAWTTGAATTLTAVPYFAWANREMGPMTVWVRARA